MAKPYLIFSHWRTGSKFVQRILDDGGIVDAQKRYGTDKHNIDNICADIYYNHNVADDSKRTKPNFNLGQSLQELELAFEFYRDNAEKDKLVAYSLRTNHAIQRKVFEEILPIVKKIIKVPSYIITLREPLDIAYSIHRIKEKIESEGGKMNPDLSDEDIFESYASSLSPTYRLIKDYDAEYIVYPDDFKIWGSCRAKRILHKIGCSEIILNNKFEPKLGKKVPHGYRGDFKTKYRRRTMQWKKWLSHFKRISGKGATNLSI